MDRSAALKALAELRAFVEALPQSEPVPEPVPEPAPEPPTVPAQPKPAYVMPDPPLPPAGPFTAREPGKIGAAAVSLKQRSFKSDYIALRHDNPAIALSLLELEDIDCFDVGSLFYGDLGCAVKEARIARIKALVKQGRPFFAPVARWGHGA